MQNKEIFTKAVGVTFDERQKHVKNCTVGQRLSLVREKDNEFDPNAIAIYSGNNQIGYVAKEIAAQLATKMDNGTEYECRVLKVTGGDGDKAFGLNIKIVETQDNEKKSKSAITGQLNEYVHKVPYKPIRYSGLDYIVVPINESACLAVTGYAVLFLQLESVCSVFGDETGKAVRAKIMDIRSEAIMNRKDKINMLSYEDFVFYKFVFSQSEKLMKYFEETDCLRKRHRNIMKLFHEGLIGSDMPIKEVCNLLNELTGREFQLEGKQISCEGQYVNLYDVCRLIYGGNKVGLFDNFFDGNNVYNGTVIEYIKKMGPDVIKNIDNEYRRIKGSCPNIPTMGKYGSIEFAGALMIWKYCRENILSKFDILGPLMISLGETIGCAYNYMSPGEWSDKMDIVINNSDLVNYDEWNQIYNYLKDNHMVNINALEFCDGKFDWMERTREYERFVVLYNSLPDFASVFVYYQRQGLRLKEDMPFRISN